MKPPIENSVILITGASSGLGMEFARQLASRAKGLILVARRLERLETLKTELQKTHPHLKISVEGCDLLDLACTERMIAKVLNNCGTVDVLINNAGLGDFCFYEKSDWARTRNIIDLNVTALAYLTHRLIGPMVSAGRGGILNVSSGFGFQFLPGFAAYAGSKHFVTGFTEVLRSELAGAGIVVSQLCPGPVDTEFIEIAGSSTDMKLPGWVLMSAEACVRWGLQGFEVGRPLIVPGLATRATLFLTRNAPRPLQRCFSNLAARQLRKAMDVDA